MDISSSDREVIAALFESAGYIDLFQLHEEFSLSPAQILETLERLSQLGLVDRDSLRARLTVAGREWVVASRRVVFFSPRKDWRKFEARDKLLSSNEPYLPDLSRVDRAHFVGLSGRNKN